MALAPRPHGARIEQKSSGSVALALTNASIWGVVAVAADADAAVFPLNTAVLVDDLDGALADAGENGTLRNVLTSLRTFGKSIGVVVRVAEGEDDADTSVNVVAGIAKLRLAQQSLGVRPRVIGAPGLDDVPVRSALGLSAVTLNGRTFCRSIGATPAEVYADRQTVSGREISLIDDNVTIGNVVHYGTAHAIGLRCYLNKTAQGYSKTISNLPLPGVTGIENPRTWDLNSTDTEMGLINGADVTGLIQRDGIRFWGNRTCSATPDYAFESAVLTDQALNDSIIEGVFPWIDQPLTPQLAATVIESINLLFDREKRAGRIPGARAYLAEGNTPAELKAGRLRIGKRWMFYAPAEDVIVESWMDDTFLVDFAELVAA
jgi:phage tail sheath protein FI